MMVLFCGISILVLCCFPDFINSKLINKAVPGTIDERVLNLNATTPEAVLENINLCIYSGKAIGCNIGDITVEDIITGDVASSFHCKLTVCLGSKDCPFCL